MGADAPVSIAHLTHKMALNIAAPHKFKAEPFLKTGGPGDFDALGRLFFHDYNLALRF
jgi:hypothetical protein